MVQAMVETHTTDLGSSKDGNKMGMDIVRGKGKSIISGECQRVTCLSRVKAKDASSFYTGFQE